MAVKWEYKFVCGRELPDVVAKLNKLGEEGWEAVGFDYAEQGDSIYRDYLVLLKRESN